MKTGVSKVTVVMRREGKIPHPVLEPQGKGIPWYDGQIDVAEFMHKDDLDRSYLHNTSKNTSAIGMATKFHIHIDYRTPTRNAKEESCQQCIGRS